MKTVKEFIEGVEKVAKEYPEVFNTEMFIQDFNGKLHPMDNLIVITDADRKTLTISLSEGKERKE